MASPSVVAEEPLADSREPEVPNSAEAGNRLAKSTFQSSGARPHFMDLLVDSHKFLEGSEVFRNNLVTDE